MKSNLVFASFSLSLALLLTACGQADESSLSATNKFNSITVTHWYETFNFIPGDAKNFADYYKNDADTLLARSNDAVPDTLKGLWYMDGNPLSDKTFSMSSVQAINSAGDLRWVVGSPMMYSWVDTALAHGTIALVIATHLEYELKWADCPLDVRLERQFKYGMKDGSCKAADRQFGVVTPIVKVGSKQIRVPQSLAYFDLYLRPKTADNLVWERRSRVLGTLGALASVFTQGLSSGGYHRYQFTQIMDKDGNQLSSFNKFQSDVTALAVKARRSVNDYLFLTCEEGRDGCNLKHTQTVDSMSETDILDFAKIPLF